MNPLKFTPALIASFLLSACSEKEEIVEKKPTAITVETAPATRDTIQTWTYAQGNARATRREYLNFENAGRIAYIKPDLREGSEVKSGELLVKQDQRRLSADLETAESSVTESTTQRDVARTQLTQALTEQTLAEKTFERFRVLLEKESASQQEYDEAKAKADKATSGVAQARAQLRASEAQIIAAEARSSQSGVAFEETELRSPIDGIVSRLNVVEGFYMTPGIVRTTTEEALLQTIPIVIIDPSNYEITVDVPPVQGAVVKVGQTAYIKPGGSAEANTESFDPDAFPVHGEVYSVTPSVTPGRRTILVKIRTTKGAELLQDGTFTTIWIATLKKENAIVAPLGSFIYRENEPFVFIANPETKKAEMRKVTLGIQGIDEQEILTGVSEGELIITGGRYQLSNGVSINLLQKGAK